MTIMQGDAYNIEITLKDDEGHDITPLSASAVEVALGKTVIQQVQYDAEAEAYVLPLTQEQTFAMQGTYGFEVRVKFSTGDVIGVKLSAVNVRPAISREVL